ncbi:MAG: hypothetical protein QOJ42_5708 [Acidobacteriaceae bacterium]|jgi:hypothetical protein|nr:hypothetical protein [Acidobacteriaceae bacterium]MDX6461672.1 hypothetical protein [Acidobacteriaceae bacterium]
MIGSIHGKVSEIENPASYLLSVSVFLTSHSASPFVFRRGFSLPYAVTLGLPTAPQHLLGPPLRDLGQFLSPESQIALAVRS